MHLEKPDSLLLTDQQLYQLLAIEPALRHLPAAQGMMTAYDSIVSIHRHGIPQRLGSNSIQNCELMGSMRVILYKIDQETNTEKKRRLLHEVAECVEDCVPVTQGRIAQLHMKLASTSCFDKQMEVFISHYKDRIVDQVLYHLYPEMKDPLYASHHFSQPSLQFPHVKNGFVSLLGSKLGLNPIGAHTDPNKNTMRAIEKQNEFEKLFHEKISIDEIVKDFIIDINGRYGQIEISALSKWCIPSNLGEEAARHIFYDEEAHYPSYSPPYQQAYGYEPYLTEPLGYFILEKLGYLIRSSSS